MKAMVLKRAESGRGRLAASRARRPAGPSRPRRARFSSRSRCAEFVTPSWTRSRAAPRRPASPIVLGHQVVGRVERAGERRRAGSRSAIASASRGFIRLAGSASSASSGAENLCPEFRATGRDAHGGYAEHMTVPEDFAYRIPDEIQRRASRPTRFAPAPSAIARCGSPTCRTAADSASPASAPPATSSSRWSDSGSPETEVYVFARSEGERDVRARARGRLGGRQRRRASGEAGRHHRHDPRLEAGRRGPPTPRARRPARRQRHPQGRRRQGLSC